MQVTGNWLMSILPTVRCFRCRFNRKTNKARFDAHSPEKPSSPRCTRGSSERRARLIDQLELQLEELETAATEDAMAAEQATEKTGTVRAFTRRHPVRKPFPDHLPRERVVVEAPAACTCCGSDRLVKMGEDITETLEVIPRQWKVIQTVREKFTCRACERISQPPAPFHAIPRGWAGPMLGHPQSILPCREPSGQRGRGCRVSFRVTL